MTEQQKMLQRLRQLRRTANDRHGAVRAVFSEYRANIDERRRLEGQLFRPGIDAEEHKHLQQRMQQLEKEFEQLDAAYQEAQEHRDNAGALVSRCEEYLEQQGVKVDEL